MTRRTFAAVASQASLAAQPKKIRAAMIGTGHGHAASKVRALRSMPEYEFVGICHPDADDPAIEDAFQNIEYLKVADVLRDPKLQQGIKILTLEATERCVQKKGWRLIEKEKE